MISTEDGMSTRGGVPRFWAMLERLSPLRTVYGLTLMASVLTRRRARCSPAACNAPSHLLHFCCRSSPISAQHCLGRIPGGNAPTGRPAGPGRGRPGSLVACSGARPRWAGLRRPARRDAGPNAAPSPGGRLRGGPPPGFPWQPVPVVAQAVHLEPS